MGLFANHLVLVPFQLSATDMSYILTFSETMIDFSRAMVL